VNHPMREAHMTIRITDVQMLLTVAGKIVATAA
jgi:hypothetical protein